MILVQHGKGCVPNIVPIECRTAEDISNGFIHSRVQHHPDEFVFLSLHSALKTRNLAGRTTTVGIYSSIQQKLDDGTRSHVNRQQKRSGVGGNGRVEVDLGPVDEKFDGFDILI